MNEVDDLGDSENIRGQVASRNNVVEMVKSLGGIRRP